MITFDHVTYTYEGQTVPSLRDCSFTVGPGELILFTGESGCGKTTIIKLINGLLQHGGGGTLEGAVTVNGRDVAGTPLWELAQTVGSVFQNPKSQFFNLDTTGEVLFGLESRGASRQMVWREELSLPIFLRKSLEGKASSPKISIWIRWFGLWGPVKAMAWRRFGLFRESEAICRMSISSAGFPIVPSDFPIGLLLTAPF